MLTGIRSSGLLVAGGGWSTEVSLFVNGSIDLLLEVLRLFLKIRSDSLEFAGDVVHENREENSDTPSDIREDAKSFERPVVFEFHDMNSIPWRSCYKLE